MVSLTRCALLAIFAVIFLSAPFTIRAEGEGEETPTPGGDDAAKTEETKTEETKTEEPKAGDAQAPSPPTEGGEKKDDTKTDANAPPPPPKAPVEEECSLGNSETEKGIVQPDGTCKSSATSNSVSAIVAICTAGFLIITKLH